MLLRQAIQCEHGLRIGVKFAALVILTQSCFFFLLQLQLLPLFLVIVPLVALYQYFSTGANTLGQPQLSTRFVQPQKHKHQPRHTTSGEGAQSIKTVAHVVQLRAGLAQGRRRAALASRVPWDMAQDI